MLPELDGLAVMRAMRAAKIETPVLILSALGTLDDRIKGLREGGDDYLVKPFAFSELLARLDALMRRRVPDSAIASRTKAMWRFRRHQAQLRRPVHGSPVAESDPRRQGDRAAAA